MSLLALHRISLPHGSRTVQQAWQVCVDPGYKNAEAVEFEPAYILAGKIDREKNIVWVSRIFKFDSKNFERGKEDIIPFIIPFIEDEKERDYLKNARYKLKYLDYNWDLNTLQSVQ